MSPSLQDAIDTAITAAVDGDQSAIAGWSITRLIPFNPVDKKTVAEVCVCVGVCGGWGDAEGGSRQVGWVGTTSGRQLLAAVLLPANCLLLFTLAAAQLNPAQPRMACPIDALC